MKLDNYTRDALKDIVLQSYSYAEVLRKIGYSSRCGGNTETLKRRLTALNINVDHFIPTRKRTDRCPENIFIKNSTASQYTLRKWYLKGNYSEYKCSICGLLPMWNGKPLTLILDHINGENHDDRLSNLRWVCPNCDRQLETTGYTKFHSRKKETKKKIKQTKHCFQCGKIIKGTSLCRECYDRNRHKHIPNRELLKNSIRNTSFVSIGKQYGVSDNAVRKWCKYYDLPYQSSIIHNFSDEEWITV